MANLMIDLKVDDRDLKTLERQLRSFPKAMPRVMSRAINKTVISARVQAARGIIQEINLTVTRAKRAMIITKATFSRWVGKIHFQKRRIRIIFFGAKQKPKGVTYKIERDKGRQLIPGAFITTVRGGQNAENRGVFARKFVKGSRTKRVGRFSIIQQRGPSMARLFKDNPRIVASVTQTATRNITKFITAQVVLIFKK